ncbi:MAG: hypothetical protein ABEJ23_09725 [Haloarculaceae archaeon]
MDSPRYLSPLLACPDGTAVLSLGPPMVGKTDYAEALLADRLAAGDAAVVVSTDAGAVDVAALRTAVPDGSSPRLGVATLADGEGSEGGHRLRATLSSPGDLTGISIALSNYVEAFSTRPDDARLWFVVDSLTTVAAYTDPQHLYQFVHYLTGLVADARAVGLFVVHEGTVAPETLDGLESLFDRRLEFETDGGDARVRLSAPETPGEWIAFEPDRQPARPAPSREVAPGPAPDSLSEALARLEAAGQTLTLYESDAVPASLAAHFGQFNVPVETARSAPDQGLRPFALLHRDGDAVAASPLSVLRAAVDVADPTDSPFAPAEFPDVLRRLDRSVFSTTAATRRELIRASRVFEMAALRAGTGTVRAGFQRLSRLADDERARDIYRRLVEAGVDVTVYGDHDVEDVGVPGATVSDAAAQELRDSWFVVYDGGGDASRAGALLAEEQTPGRFDGQWTHDAQFAATLDSYLRETYPVAPA